MRTSSKFEVPVTAPFMEEQDLQQAESGRSGWADPVAKLKLAIERDEFQLFCQPILALADTGGYPMAEILVRMREEERTMLPPGDFLPVLEHYQMMPLLDRWVVRNTIKLIAAGSPIGRYTVNLSGQTLEDADFPRFIAAQLTSNRVPATALAFEIAEHDALVRLQAAARFAAAYHALGGALMLDDFGRDSVSFVAVKALSVEFVKVDGRLVRNIVASETAHAKLKTILQVGNAFGFSLIAECVENHDVLMRLKALGVAFAQGFGICEPRSAASFASPEIAHAANAV